MTFWSNYENSLVNMVFDGFEEKILETAVASMIWCETAFAVVNIPQTSTSKVPQIIDSNLLLLASCIIAHCFSFMKILKFC